MSTGCLKTDLSRDVDCPSTNPGKNLRNNDLCGSSAGCAEGNHETVAEDVEGDTCHHPPFVVAGILDAKRNDDRNCARSEGEGVGDVGGFFDSVTADNLEPGIKVCPRKIVDKEVEKPKGTRAADAK